MNGTVLKNGLIILAFVLVGSFFVINTGGPTTDKDKVESTGKPTGRKSDNKADSEGRFFKSGVSNFTGRRIDYTIFTCDYGVHWWAVKETEGRWHIIAPAEVVYPGLLKSLSDALHAEIELQDYEQNRKRR